MFKVEEIMGNFSEVIATFETEEEAYSYIHNAAMDDVYNEFGYDLDEFEMDIAFENALSYYNVIKEE